MSTKNKQQNEEVEVGGGATGESSVAEPTGTRAKAPGKSNSNSEPMPKAQNPAGTAIEETDDESNTKPTGDNSASNKASVAAKGSAAVKESVVSLFDGENLSEDFKSKAVTIFEAAVAEKVAQHRQVVEQELNEQFEQRLTESVEQLSEKVEAYLDRCAKDWFEENQIAIEQGLRTEITEEFVDSLKELFVLHNIDLPDEKVNVAEQLAQQVSELEEQLRVAADDNIEMANALVDYAKQDIFNQIAEGLADTQVERLAQLAEGVEFDDPETYKQKLETVKETFFAKGAAKPVAAPKLNEQVDPVEEAAPAVAGPIAAYVSAISRTVK